MIDGNLSICFGITQVQSLLSIVMVDWKVCDLFPDRPSSFSSADDQTLSVSFMGSI
jgi:hypothetical protein